MKHHNQKNNLGMKGFLSVSSPYHCISFKKSGQELKQGGVLEAGAVAEAMKECCNWLGSNG